MLAKYRTNQSKAIFAAAVALAIFLVFFGIKLISLGRNDFSPEQFFFIGTVLTVAGVFVAANSNMAHRWLIGFLLIFIGFYQFARAAEVINAPWLVNIAAVACFLTSIAMVYVTFPVNKPVKLDNLAKDPKQ